MTPSQEAQKERARHEAEQHMSYAAVDRMRDAQLERYEQHDAMMERARLNNARPVRDANGYSAADKG